MFTAGLLRNPAVLDDAEHTVFDVAKEYIRICESCGNPDARSNVIQMIVSLFVIVAVPLLLFLSLSLSHGTAS